MPCQVQMCLWSVRKRVRCEVEGVRFEVWALQWTDLVPVRAVFVTRMSSFITWNCSARSLSSWLVPTEVRPTLRLFLLILTGKNSWPAGKNIYIRQLLHNQREWSLSSVGSVGPLCVHLWRAERTMSPVLEYTGDTGGHWSDNASRHLLSPYKGQLTDSLLFSVFLTICINLLELVRTFQLKISTEQTALIFTLAAFTAENSWKLGRENIWGGIWKYFIFCNKKKERDIVQNIWHQSYSFNMEYNLNFV